MTRLETDFQWDDDVVAGSKAARLQASGRVDLALGLTSFWLFAFPPAMLAVGLASVLHGGGAFAVVTVLVGAIAGVLRAVLRVARPMDVRGRKVLLQVGTRSKWVDVGDVKWAARTVTYPRTNEYGLLLVLKSTRFYGSGVLYTVNDRDGRFAGVLRRSGLTIQNAPQSAGL